MKNGQARFDYFLNQVNELLIKAAKQKNPALWLYKNNARTPFFMLEGLAKMYISIHNKKKFTKLKEQFKLIEDVLGAIDYYDAFSTEFSGNKKIPATVTAYLQAQTREKIQSLNELLKEKEWLGADNKRIKKIQKKLSEADWLKAEDEIKEMNEFYGQSIYEIVAFTEKESFHFENVEADVHELRRKLRWLSIYPQAVRGCIQLSQAKKAPKHLEKYLTNEIVTSPFNKIPDAANNEVFLLLEQNYFYALSWMIAELGKLKDDGLRIIAIKEALQQTSSVTDAAALKKAYQLTGDKQLKLEEILLKADAIAKTYFKEKNLEYLVVGIAAATA
jgi:hypothetical protein